MNKKLSLVIVAVLVAISFGSKIQKTYKNDHSWSEYKHVHSKQYKSESEEAMRYQRWMAMSKMVNEHNERFSQGLETYDMEVNAFSDRTKEELAAQLSSNTFEPKANKVTKLDVIKRSLSIKKNSRAQQLTLTVRFNDGSNATYIKQTLLDTGAVMKVSLTSDQFSDKVNDCLFRVENLPNGVNVERMICPKDFDNYIDSDYETFDSYFAVKFSYEAPEQFDWRNNFERCPQADGNCVSPPKRQGDCGSCFAFSAIGALEAQLLIKNIYTGPLSEQQIIDCAKTGRKNQTDGCIGGYPPRVFNDISNEGIMLEKDYPYKEVTEECKYDKSKTITGFSSIYIDDYENEDDIKKAIANLGPATFGISVSAEKLTAYKSGVYRESCGDDGGHAMLVVGYGTDSINGDYWIFKNSWGKWGINKSGFGYLERNTNYCGFTKRVVFPTLI